MGGYEHAQLRVAPQSVLQNPHPFQGALKSRVRFKMTLRTGQRGSYMAMDACGRDATPDTVAATCLPPWLLPTMPARVRDKLRPDILIINGLPLHAGNAFTTASPSLSHLQRSCRIHMIEVGYCSDSSCRWLKRAPLKNCNTSAFALLGCWRNRPLRTLTCLLLLPCHLLCHHARPHWDRL